MPKSIINTYVPEETVGEVKPTPKETHLLEAILHLLLYVRDTNGMDFGKFRDLLYVSGVSKPTNLAAPKTLVS